MEELLKIFDDKRNVIGIADRSEVHSKGIWHETFHCWILSRENGIDYIYFQIRSEKKKDYPSLLDITAAGHILANETVIDGVREVKEELGIDVHIDDLVSLGVIEDCIISNELIDKELSNVYLYIPTEGLEFEIQKDELSGILRTEFKNFYDLCLNNVSEITVDGFEIDEHLKKTRVQKKVSLNHFVPHQNSYLERVVELISKRLNN